MHYQAGALVAIEVHKGRILAFEKFSQHLTTRAVHIGVASVATSPTQIVIDHKFQLNTPFAMIVIICVHQQSLLAGVNFAVLDCLLSKTPNASVQRKI